MDYEKKYKEAFERAKEVHNEHKAQPFDVMLKVFPELKESEDERIRKTLIDYFNICHGDYYGELKRKDILAWLEKQGEQKGYTFKSIPRLLDMIEPSDKANAYCQKLIDALAKEGYDTDAKIVEGVLKGWNGEDVPMAVMDEQKPFDYENANIQQTDFAPKVDMPRYSIGDVLCDKSCTTLDKEAQPNFEIIDIRNGMYICDKCSFPISQQDEYELVAKKIEQKSTDEIEPKFNVGDWITDGYLYNKITDVLEDRYIVDTKFAKRSSIPFKFENYYHLWTIQDAKDGDVLAYVTDEEDLWIMIYWSLYEPYEGHVHYHALLVNDNFSDKGTCCISINNLKPATKEQCDLLFSKMKESDYKWDAEKKELNKMHVIDEGKAEMDYCFTKMMNGERVSPAWSEEDEAKLKSACALIRNTSLNGNEDVVDSTIDWLESLK